uniref:Odorant receptor n=1 Tax=Pediculus humanus TaxID=121225 RepID=A0A0U3U487_9NEOP|nr:OR6 [Pediculus humanus]
MKSNFNEFFFSNYFNYLAYVGGWTYKTNNINTNRIIIFYQILCLVSMFASIALQLADLWRVSGNLDKVTYNMCTSVIVIDTTSKVVVLLNKTKIINKLRLNLWNDFYKYQDEDIEKLKNSITSELKRVSKMFHVAGLVFYPVWISVAYFSYLWGPRELPFPAFLPINHDDSLSYNLCFLLEIVLGTIILTAAIETNLIVFSLVLQMVLQYKILYRRILKVSDVYEGIHVDDDDDDDNDDVIPNYDYNAPNKKKEINFILKRKKTENYLKNIINRQLILSHYVKLFEFGFNHYFLVQITGGSTLVIMNGLHVIKMTYQLSSKIGHQAAYLFFIIVNFFFNCFYTSKLVEEFNSIGEAAYATSWYKMDANLQKYFLMIIIQAQKQPKITAGRFILMNLNTFLTMLRNTYSWLMLIRQFEIK